MLSRGVADKAHFALAYIVVVIAAAAYGGRKAGMMTAFVTFLCFNYFFLPPYSTLYVAHGIDWVILLAYLVTAGIAAQLFHFAQRQTATAHDRALEIERLSTLGAETLNVGRPEDALGAVANVIRNAMDVASCDVFVVAPNENAPRRIVRSPRGATNDLVQDLVLLVAREGVVAAERADGSTCIGDLPVHALDTAHLEIADAISLVVPLRVKDRTVGVVSLSSDRPIEFDAAKRRFLHVLSYYAALGVERVRLTANAEHAWAIAEADRLKEALLATVSHELRTPLTTIKASAHEIAESGDTRGSEIEREADFLNQLVADILDLSRVQAGAMTMEPEVNDAQDLIGAALRQITPASGRRIKVCECPDGPLFGRFDFTHSLRIIVNLLENALKYSPAGSSVEITAQRDGSVLSFHVSDRGPGIPSADRHLIYQAFYRSYATSSATRGTGLGLSIANQLAQAQGGTIRHALRPGGGSIFTYRIPAADVPTDFCESTIG